MNDMSNWDDVPPAPTFEDFFRKTYRPLIRDVILTGWNPHDVEEAVSAAMADVLQRWDAIENPHAYARRAAISHLINGKQRGLQRIRERIVQRGDLPLEYYLDPGLTVWEQQEWVSLLLKSLPRAQREVLACMVDMLSQKEIAQLLGKTEPAVRQNLRAARKRLANCLAEIDGKATASGEETP
jgi:RNA polymerase sigma factor (sigma-70 family)